MEPEIWLLIIHHLYLLLNTGGRGYGVSPALSESINRESLLDAFCLLYKECDKDALRKRDKNIAEFVNKCTSQLKMHIDINTILYIH